MEIEMEMEIGNGNKIGNGRQTGKWSSNNMPMDNQVGAADGCSILWFLSCPKLATISQCDLLLWDVGNLLAVGLVAEWHLDGDSEHGAIDKEA